MHARATKSHFKSHTPTDPKKRQRENRGKLNENDLFKQMFFKVKFNFLVP